MSKILSISIAAYNVEKFIEETLDSLKVPEVLDDIEVFIVDDGGTDNTIEIAKKYAEEYPDTFIPVSKENGGWGSTVNTGIKNATGKYFKLLDGDDYFVNLNEFVEFLKKTDADMVYTPFFEFYEDNREEKHYELDSFLPLEKEVPLSAQYFKNRFTMHSCVFKTEKIKNVEITEHCFYTDVEFILKSVLNVKTVIFCPIEVYAYRIGRAGQSVSKEGYRKHYTEHLKVLFVLLKIYKTLEDGSVLKELYRDRLQGVVNLQYYIFLVLKRSFQHAKELKHFDDIIKNSFPELYPCDRKRIQVYRKLGFLAYWFVTY